MAPASPIPGPRAPVRPSGFLLGVRCGLRGVGRCVVTPRLWPWALVPALLTTCLFAAPFVALHAALEETIRTFVDEHLGATGSAVAAWGFTFVLAAAGLVLMYLVFAPLARVVAAPFLSVLSDRTVAGLLGRDTPVQPGGPFLRYVVRPVGDAVLFLLVRVAVMLVASPLLFLGPASFLFFVVMVPLEGLDRMDVAQSARAVPVGRRLSFVREHFGACTGLGAVAAVLLLVPVANVMLLPGLAVGAVLLDREVSPDFPEAHP